MQMLIRLLIACATENAASLLAQKLWLYGDEDPSISCEPVAIDRACRAAALMKPDAALLDHEPGMQMLPTFMRTSPATRVLLLENGAEGVCDLIEIVRRGAVGWIEQAIEPRLVAKAVRVAAAGGCWFGRETLLDALRSKIAAMVPEPIDVGPLTNREEQVLHLIGQGLTNKEIGRRLAISDHTVKTHLHRVYSKLHQSGRYKAFLAQR
jgi:DNA-binding NarL/FixJ family response regulator